MRDKRFPNYPDDTDYTTNAPSYYEDLARKEKLIRLLAERIWGYEKILDDTLEEIQERFREWDKNLEDFPEDVKELLQKWLDDGTLDHIINDTIFNWKLDTTIFEQFRDITTAQLELTTNRTRITPDDYEGTDIEKLQQVFDYAVANKIETIELTRTYDLTGGSIFFDVDSRYPFEHLTFMGGTIIKNDAGYIFDCLANDNRRNAPRFNGTVFTTQTGSNVYVFNGDKMIRPNMVDCTFWRIGLIKTYSYIQSLRMVNCETGQLGCNFIEGTMAFDCSITEHRGEASNAHHFLHLVATETNQISFYGFRITNSLFEGYTTSTPLIFGTGYGLAIDNCYFEANMTHIKFTRGVGAARLNGSIENTVFSSTKTIYDIEFDGVSSDTRWISFKNITSNVISGKYLTSANNQYHHYDNINLYAGGSFSPGSFRKQELNTLPYTIKKSSTGDSLYYEFKLPTNNDGPLYQLNNKQYLVNFAFSHGSNAYYSAHLTGILSFDGYLNTTSSTAKIKMTLTELSEKNTGGNIEGVSQEPDYRIYFTQTGNDEIEPLASDFTIRITFPKSKFEQGRSSASILPLSNIMINPFTDI